MAFVTDFSITVTCVFPPKCHKTVFLPPVFVPRRKKEKGKRGKKEERGGERRDINNYESLKLIEKLHSKFTYSP